MTCTKSTQSRLYPEIEPYAVDKLAVSDRHTIVYEQAGNPRGRPALFLHGGPGVGILPDYRRFFDPAHYRQVLVDQRGAGRSTPHAEIRDNTTWDIVDDLEKLRVELGFDDWVVMGGSWGSLLALCYAIRHPASVAAIIIRGIFLGRKAEIDWLHAPGGASRLYPEEWEQYTAPVAGASDYLAAYCDLLASDDPDVAAQAAAAWSRWEGTMNTLWPDPEAMDALIGGTSAVSIARIESYYTARGFFLESDNFVLDNADRIAHIPCHIVNGRYDIICPSTSAWELHRALPRSTLTIVPDGAHSPLDPGMAAAMVEAANACRTL